MIQSHDLQVTCQATCEMDDETFVPCILVSGHAGLHEHFDDEDRYSSGFSWADAEVTE